MASRCVDRNLHGGVIVTPGQPPCVCPDGPDGLGPVCGSCGGSTDPAQPPARAALAAQIDTLIEGLTRLAWTLRIDPKEHPIQPDTSEHQ